MTRHHHYGCCWVCVLVIVGMIVAYAALLAAWLVWAAGILLIAGPAWATGHRELAGRMVRTLVWDSGGILGR